MTDGCSYNQFLRLAERRLVFNVHELKKVAAKSLDRPESDVKTLSKLAEGGFNRVFEITMNDDTRVIARLPYPSTYPNRFAVASEVATLNLIRSNGIAVPKVLAYSINSENAVGSEYIIMEKVSGKSIGDTWFDLTEKQRVKVILGIVKLEAKLFTIDLPAYGSIYHPVDLPSDMGRVPLEPQTSGQDFCVGPDAALKWWYKERSLLDVERGPCKYLSSVAKSKVLTWLLLPKNAVQDRLVNSFLQSFNLLIVSLGLREKNESGYKHMGNLACRLNEHTENP